MKILFTGGGTGGHIFPILAVARELRLTWTRPEPLELFYLGPEDDFAETLLSQEGIKVKSILAGKIRRYLNISSLISNFIDLLKLPIGFLQSFFYIFFWAPDAIFSKGGYGSFPTVLAGWLLGVPIFLHESDIVPGLANKILSKFAIDIFVSFPKTEYFSPKKIIVVGNPIRPGIWEGSKEVAKELFEISGEKPVILILGGSQGAQRINDLILTILPEFLKEFEIIHQVGEKNFKEVEKEVAVILPEELKKYYHFYPFLREIELKHAYQAADLIVARAGSGTIFEIAAAGKPSILIPLPESAQGHQIKNAYAYAQTGAAIVIEEENFTPRFFLEKIRYLFSRPDFLTEMSEKAKEFSCPRAGRIIAEYLLDYLSFQEF